MRSLKRQLGFTLLETVLALLVVGGLVLSGVSWISHVRAQLRFNHQLQSDVRAVNEILQAAQQYFWVCLDSPSPVTLNTLRDKRWGNIVLGDDESDPSTFFHIDLNSIEIQKERDENNRFIVTVSGDLYGDSSPPDAPVLTKEQLLAYQRAFGISQSAEQALHFKRSQALFYSTYRYNDFGLGKSLSQFPRPNQESIERCDPSDE